MRGKLSDELINISTMLLTANARGEVIRLAGELNAIIEKAINLENTENVIQDNKKTSSATIKFTKLEIDKMSKTFKKEFIANGCVARIIKRPSGKNTFCYEIRYRRNGYNISVSNTDLNKAKELFVVATNNLESPINTAQGKLKFGVILGEWLNYKKGKIAEQTWKEYAGNAKTYIPEELRERSIKNIRTAELDTLLQELDNPRKYEDVRTLLNSVFKYAIASGIITHNPVTLIPFIRAERKKRDRITRVQILNFLTRIKDCRFDRIRQLAYVLYFFGLRPCEIDKEAHFENGFLICRNRKRKNRKIEYKKIPIPKQAQGLIDFDKPIKPQLSYDRWLDLMEDALGNGLTPYNLRHTFASICAEYAKENVVELWMGDSPERLVGKTYVHYSDEFMKAEMNKVEFPT